MKTLIPAIVIVLAVGALIAAGVVFGAIPELQVRDVLAQPPEAKQKIKVHGILHSIEQGTRPLKFTIRDKENAGQLMQVVADELRPDIFEVGKDVAVEGFFDNRAVLMNGTKIYTKCPSKYEASKDGEQDAN